MLGWSIGNLCVGAENECVMVIDEVKVAVGNDFLKPEAHVVKKTTWWFRHIVYRSI